MLYCSVFLASVRSLSVGELANRKGDGGSNLSFLSIEASLSEALPRRLREGFVSKRISKWKQWKNPPPFQSFHFQPPLHGKERVARLPMSRFSSIERAAIPRCLHSLQCRMDCISQQPPPERWRLATHPARPFGSARHDRRIDCRPTCPKTGFRTTYVGGQTFTLRPSRSNPCLSC